MENGLHDLLVILATVVATTFCGSIVLPYFVRLIESRKKAPSPFPELRTTRVKFARNLVDIPKSFTLTLSESGCGVRWGVDEDELVELRGACEELRTYFKNNPPGAHFNEASLDFLLNNVEFFLDRQEDLQALIKKNGGSSD